MTRVHGIDIIHKSQKVVIYVRCFIKGQVYVVKCSFHLSANKNDRRRKYICTENDK
jgi:hypothetical protein